MSQAHLRIHLDAALKSTEIRKACAALEQFRSGIDLLEDLSEETLIVLREHVHKTDGEKHGPRGDFLRAYLVLVDNLIQEARQTNRRLMHGITGGGGAGSAVAFVPKRGRPREY